MNDNIIHYQVFGNGTPMLIINGGPGMNSDGFQSLAKRFGQSKMAIIYDQRGTGKSKLSEINSSTINIDSMVNDIEILRNHLNIENWIVFGHSFGGMLGSYYASKFPDRIKALILSSSGGINMDLFSHIDIQSRLSVTDRDSLSYWNAKISEGDSSQYTRLQRGKLLAPAYVYDKSNVPTIAYRLTQGNSEVNRLVYQSMRAINFDCTEALKKFESPVLIIQGKQDIIPESVGTYAKDVFPNSTFILVDNCVHYGWLDNPKSYFKSIFQFLESI